jgi:hypothetical protein
MMLVTEPRSVFSSRNDTNDACKFREFPWKLLEDEIEEVEQMEEERIRHVSQSERVEALPDKEHGKPYSDEGG